MNIVTGLTRKKGEANERLVARAIAIQELMGEGVVFTGSPTNREICIELGIVEGNVYGSSKAFGGLLLKWASMKKHK